ncbi:hypothetical protein BAY61_15525 [Prauserella marina]|uniref:Uncharacterized protein n=1 Tax=Prauserella marina TaxID=530584 RepID=A0A222VQQ7_9PSEU|nr:hypothetical protein [Prauserella marina]ASR36182.1 hypothetical protein BAY61_15525 [Prauserella marina]PWV76933.1 hypothetical protein DES30_105150 [Prauserella marina]SDD00659.1 hypothetical protein SAMN05421630_105151 [Prauserella marina]
MTIDTEPRLYEVRIGGFGDDEGALALTEPIARLLCPDEWHEGPCEVPWGFSLAGTDGAELVVGIYTTESTAAEILARVRALAGPDHPSALTTGDPGLFPDVITQYEIEHGTAPQ